jgi:hypothetical protein
MGNASRAGAIYAVIVFLIGFVLGTIRILLVAPRLGDTPAVILETPIILAASWFVCRGCVGRFRVRRRVGLRFVMCAVAFLVLMAAEFALGELVFGRSLVEQLAGYGSTPGVIGLAAQIVFAAFPVMQVKMR